MFISCLCIHIDCGSAILASVVLPQVSIYCTIVHLPIHITHTHVSVHVYVQNILVGAQLCKLYMYIFTFTHTNIYYMRDLHSKDVVGPMREATVSSGDTSSPWLLLLLKECLCEL